MIMTITAAHAHLPIEPIIDDDNSEGDYHDAAVKIQCMARVLLARKAWGDLYVRFIQNEVQRLQNEAREARIHKKRTRKRELLRKQATRIQAIVRGSLVRKRFNSYCNESKKKRRFSGSQRSMLMETVRKRMLLDRDIERLKEAIANHDSTESFAVDDPSEQKSGGDENNDGCIRYERLKGECTRLEIKTKTLEAISKPLHKNLDTLKKEQNRLHEEYQVILAKNESIRSENVESQQQLNDILQRTATAKEELAIGSKNACTERSKAEEDLSHLVKSIAMTIQSRAEELEITPPSFAHEVSQIARDARRKARDRQLGLERPIRSKFVKKLDASIRSLDHTYNTDSAESTSSSSLSSRKADDSATDSPLPETTKKQSLIDSLNINTSNHGDPAQSKSMKKPLRRKSKNEDNGQNKTDSPKLETTKKHTPIDSLSINTSNHGDPPQSKSLTKPLRRRSKNEDTDAGNDQSQPVQKIQSQDSNKSGSVNIKIKPSRNHGLIVPTVDNEDESDVNGKQEGVRRTNSLDASKSAPPTRSRSNPESIQSSGDKDGTTQPSSPWWKVTPSSIQEEEERRRPIRRMKSWNPTNSVPDPRITKMKPRSNNGLITTIKEDDVVGRKDKDELDPLTSMDASTQPSSPSKPMKIKANKRNGLIEPIIDDDEEDAEPRTLRRIQSLGPKSPVGKKPMKLEPWSPTSKKPMKIKPKSKHGLIEPIIDDNEEDEEEPRTLQRIQSLDPKSPVGKKPIKLEPLSPTSKKPMKIKPKSKHGLIEPIIDDDDEDDVEPRTLRRIQSLDPTSPAGKKPMKIKPKSKQMLIEPIIDDDEEEEEKPRTLRRIQSWDPTRSPTSNKPMKIKPKSKQKLIEPITDDGDEAEQEEPRTLRRVKSLDPRSPGTKKPMKIKPKSKQRLIETSIDDGEDEVEEDTNTARRVQSWDPTRSPTSKKSMKVKSKSSLVDSQQPAKPRLRKLKSKSFVVADENDVSNELSKSVRRIQSWDPAKSPSKTVKVKSKSNLIETKSPAKPRLRKLKPKKFVDDDQENDQTWDPTKSPSKTVKIKSKSNLSYTKSPSKPRFKKPKSKSNLEVQNEKDSEDNRPRLTRSRSLTRSPTSGPKKMKSELKLRSRSIGNRSTKSISDIEDDADDKEQRGRYRGRRNCDQNRSSRSLTPSELPTREKRAERESRCYSLTPSKLRPESNRSSSNHLSRRSMLESITLPNLDDDSLSSSNTDNPDDEFTPANKTKPDNNQERKIKESPPNQTGRRDSETKIVEIINMPDFDKDSRDQEIIFDPQPSNKFKAPSPVTPRLTHPKPTRKSSNSSARPKSLSESAKKRRNAKGISSKIASWFTQSPADNDKDPYQSYEEYTAPVSNIEIPTPTNTANKSKRKNKPKPKKGRGSPRGSPTSLESS